ncbi:MAG: hypothetical protein ACKOE9_06400 [Vulcanococcus sp.]
MTTLIELSDKQSESLSGGWYLASNFTNLSQRNAAANVAVALGGPTVIGNGQFNTAIVGSLIA